MRILEAIIMAMRELSSHMMIDMVSLRDDQRAATQLQALMLIHMLEVQLLEHKRETRAIMVLVVQRKTSQLIQEKTSKKSEISFASRNQVKMVSKITEL